MFENTSFVVHALTNLRPSFFDYRDERNQTRCCSMFHLVEGKCVGWYYSII